MEKDIIDELFEVWSPSHYRIMQLTEEHYNATCQEQLREIHEHLLCEDTERAAREIADLISVSVNWMRRLGFSPGGMRRVIKHRIATRYRGKTEEIIDKYEDMRNNKVK